MRSGHAALEAAAVDPPFLRADIAKGKTGGLGNPQAMPVHEQEQAAVPLLVALPLGGRQHLVHLGAGQVFAFGHSVIPAIPLRSSRSR